LKGVTEVTTTTETIISTGELVDRERATTATPERGAGRAVLGTVAYVLRQLAGAFAIIVLVWLAVMLYRHLQPVALVLAGGGLVFGLVALFVRNRSLSRTD
jgi:hypothetical protein